MFCDGCGAKLQAGQRFCAGCGKPVGVVPMPSPQGRVARHTHMLGILWFAYSALHLFGAAGVWFVSRMVLPNLRAGWPVTRFLPVLLGAASIFLVVKAAAGAIAGWGLLERQPWARLLTLILAFLALLHAPLGTALGIYSLWILLPAQSGAEYERLARAA